MIRRRFATLLLASPLLAACAASYTGTSVATTPERARASCGDTAVEGVPFVEQSGREDCGPAALAMILAYWRIAATHDEIAAACPPEPGVGTKAGTMRDFARERGLKVFLIHGEIADLERELKLGRPVLVGLSQPYSDQTYTHYAVVVGLDAAAERIFLIDPARGWQENSIDGFLDEWNPVGRPTMVFLRPSSTSARSPTVNSSENGP